MATQRPCRVLIVEDNSPFRMALRDAIRARFPGVSILEAGDVAEGTRKARERAPDVVFLDISLPDGNGLDLAEVVHRERPQAALAVCTSHDTPEYREGAFRRGATHFLCKDDLNWGEVGDIVGDEIGRSRGKKGQRPRGSRTTGTKDVVAPKNEPPESGEEVAARTEKERANVDSSLAIGLEWRGDPR